MGEKKIKLESAHANKGKRLPFHKKTPYKKFTALTVILEYAVLDFGTAKNAAIFLEFRDKIAKHVVVYFKYGGPEAEKCLQGINASIYEETYDPDKNE